MTWASGLEASWDILDTDFHAFFKTPRDKMMSQNDNSEKVRISKNTSVFTWKLHLSLLDDAYTELARTLFFSI